jgi:hypothetical protein
MHLLVWKSPHHLEDHFRRHHRMLNLRSIHDYDASAREVVRIGTYFEYRDLVSGDWHDGYFDYLTRRMTAVVDNVIQTHYRCSEHYVEGLLDSTYVP